MRRATQKVFASAAVAATAQRFASFDASRATSIQNHLTEKNTMYSADFLASSVTDYLNLDLDPRYAERYNDAEVGEHIMAYICGRTDAAEGKPFRFTRETPEGGLFFSDATAEEQLFAMKRLEQRIAEEKDAGNKGFSIRSYHSDQKNVVLYILEMSEFVDCDGQCGTVNTLATKTFMTKRNAEVGQRYQRVLERLVKSIKPESEVTEGRDGIKILTCGYSEVRGGTYLDELSILIQSIPGAHIVKKFAESFSNGSHVYSFYVKGASDEALNNAATQIGMLPHRPHNPITHMYQQRILSASQVVFANALVIFAFYFTPPKMTEDFSQLRNVLKDDHASLSRLKNLRNELVQDVMSERFLGEVVFQFSDLVKELYELFQKDDLEGLAALEAKTLENLGKDARIHVLKTFFLFNKSVVKHNFNKQDKAAVAFRLNPSFLGDAEFGWPRVPHGVFLFIGPQWRGFHIRFTDIARGGVRMIFSKDRSAYLANKQSLFQENYNLAYTQLLKNKDIPEGGSKGTILVSSRTGKTLDSKQIFLQYVDAMLDVILPGEPQVHDRLKEEEIIFLGPDENTAGEFPKFGALYSKERGYSWWKSFTTGKDPYLGGIPHDTYGMTSESVRVNVMGVYEKLGLNQNTLTKFQTGGPDGDLGSNEILLSGEIYHAIVDGSGVIYDPAGLNREELTRLANERVMVEKYDAKKFSGKGFFVPAVEKLDQKLPNGTIVHNGVEFRNNFHFNDYIKCDVFIPCGGRPRSVTLKNVHNFLVGVDATGEDMLSGRLGDLSNTDKLRFKYIIEGANLFISQDARLALEAVGVVLIKDAAANKGGVTSSSIEVLTGLALTDEQHKELMSANNKDDAPQFYKDIVEDILTVVRNNARREFDSIWKESLANPSLPKTLIVDQLSSKIVDIRRYIYRSDLHEDKVFVRYVMQKYCPPTLMKKIGLDTFMERVPENYIKAIFSIYIASDYVYTSGLDASEFDFYRYMHKQHDAAVKMFGK